MRENFVYGLTRGWWKLGREERNLSLARVNKHLNCIFRRHRPTLQWRNLEDVLDEKGQKEAAPLFWAIRDARDLSAAQTCSQALEACLKLHNVSALNS